MKIIYCISGMYKSGGIERVLAGKANYLVSHGYEVAIVRLTKPIARTSSL